MSSDVLHSPNNEDDLEIDSVSVDFFAKFALGRARIMPDGYKCICLEYS